MAGNIWFISDTHFGHANVLKFTRKNGERLRPFDTLDEMHDCMVTAWNETVKPHDKVYHLGDFAMSRKSIPWAKCLHGHKRLIMGNHDTASVQDYLDVGFEKLLGYRVMDNILFSHVPVHVRQVLYRFKGNVHGHEHGWQSEDRRYLNVTVECVNYVPVHFEDIKRYFKEC